MNLDLMKFQTDKVTIFVLELLKHTHTQGATSRLLLMRYSDTVSDRHIERNTG